MSNPRFERLLLFVAAFVLVGSQMAGAQGPTTQVVQPGPAAAAQDPPAAPPQDPPAAGAQDPPPASAPPAVPGQASSEDDDDLSFQPAQPDFTVINLPTTLRLPRYKSAFRVTHRFTRPLGQGSFTDSLADLFGLDSGAQIGLEFRFAPIRGGQVVFYRTNDKTIQFTGQYSVLQASEGMPLGIAAVVTVEGTDNFSDSYSPSVGVTVSATLWDALALHAFPSWVNNTNPEPSELVEDNDTFVIGAGARLRVRKGLYLVAEAWPRLAGFKGGDPLAHVHDDHEVVAGAGTGEGKLLAAFAVEWQVGGHVFQLNVSNAWATTAANIARGAPSGQTDWYLGFHISRKFY